MIMNLFICSQTIFTAGLEKPEGVAIDFITGNIYFSDNVYQHIGMFMQASNLIFYQYFGTVYHIDAFIHILNPSCVLKRRLLL